MFRYNSHSCRSVLERLLSSTGRHANQARGSACATAAGSSAEPRVDTREFAVRLPGIRERGRRNVDPEAVLKWRGRDKLHLRTALVNNPKVWRLHKVKTVSMHYTQPHVVVSFVLAIYFGF